MSLIHHTFGPLADRAQIFSALRLLCTPWRWRKGGATEALRSCLAVEFQADAFLFANGREALLALLRSLHLRDGNEVIVQGFTCVAVSNAVIAAGGIPVYVDIDPDTLNLYPPEVEKAITSQTRAVICQHTFGIPADTDELRRICDERKLLLIEDCAHVLPDQSGPETVGRAGDFLMLSFGRDKAISGIAGGAILSRKPIISTELKREETTATHLPLWKVRRLLFYPVIYGIARPVYRIGGKALLKILGMLRILPSILTADEKAGHMDAKLHRLPNACATLALKQWQTLKMFNDHRRMLAAFYRDHATANHWPMMVKGAQGDLPLQKFPLFVTGAGIIRATVKRKNVYLDDGWTGCVICPDSVDAAAGGYTAGTDPRAENVCTTILSLPTHPSMSLSQAKKLVALLDPLLADAR